MKEEIHDARQNMKIRNVAYRISWIHAPIHIYQELTFQREEVDRNRTIKFYTNEKFDRDS